MGHGSSVVHGAGGSSLAPWKVPGLGNKLAAVGFPSARDGYDPSAVMTAHAAEALCHRVGGGHSGAWSLLAHAHAHDKVDTSQPRWFQNGIKVSALEAVLQGSASVNEWLSSHVSSSCAVCGRLALSRAEAMLPDVGFGLVHRKSSFVLLEQALASTKVVCLAGRGGNGKSVLAVSTACRLASNFAMDGVAFMNLGGADSTIHSALKTVTSQLLGSDLYQPHADGYRKLISDFLHHRRCLILLDDVWKTSAPVARSVKSRDQGFHGSS